MSNKKQSSVDFLMEKLASQGLLVIDDYQSLIAYRQAKAMHKEEHHKTYNQGLMSNFQNFDDYYTKTFGGDNE